MRRFASIRRPPWVSGLVLASACLFACAPADAGEPKPRLVVMTDIGGDPDDEQSIVRFLLTDFRSRQGGQRHRGNLLVGRQADRRLVRQRCQRGGRSLWRQSARAP
jgi:hypothetical protein